MFAHLWPMLMGFGVTDAIPNFVFGAAGVDLFFVISGFIMVYTSEPLYGRPGGSRQFLLRRIVRIVPLYWALSLASLIGRQGLASHADLTWANIIGSFLFIPTTRPAGDTTPVLSVGWTLNYEMLFYVIFSVAVLFRRRRAVAAATVVLLALYGAPFFFDTPRTTPWTVWMSSFLLEFAFGMWIGLAMREGLRFPWPASAALALAGLVVMISAFANDFALLSRCMGWGGGAAAIVAAVVLADTTSPVPAMLRPLVSIGDASYALYLLHSMVSPLLVLLRVPRIVDPARWPILYCVIVVVIAVGGGLLLNAIDSSVRTALLRRLPGAARPSRAYNAGSTI